MRSTSSSSDVVVGSTRIYKHRRRRRRRQRCVSAAVSTVHAITLGRIMGMLLYCCIIHSNVQYTNSLIINARTQHIPSSTLLLSSPMRSSSSSSSSQRIRRPLSIAALSMSNNNEISGKDGVDVVAAKPAAVKTYDRRQPNTYGGQYYNKNKRNKQGSGRDFRTHEDQQRVQLDWMVRNTAKVLGCDAPRTF